MANYYVIFRQGPAVSSDAAVGTKPTEGSEVLKELKDARLATVSAATETEAKAAARAAYPGMTDSTPLVVAEGTPTE